MMLLWISGRCHLVHTCLHFCWFRSGSTGSRGMYKLSFRKYCWTVFQGRLLIFSSSTESEFQLRTFDMLILLRLVSLVDMQWYFTVDLICIFPLTKEVECLFVCLLAIWVPSFVNFLEKEMAIPHSSILVWGILWTEESGGLQSMQSQRVGQDWVIITFCEVLVHVICLFFYFGLSIFFLLIFESSLYILDKSFWLNVLPISPFTP